MYKYRAKVIRILDGDTIDALIDLGFEVKLRKRVRLWEINAPEKKKKTKIAALRAQARLEELLSDENGEFTLISHGYGKYGRCLGEIFVKEVNINQKLLQEGLVNKYED